MKKSTRKEQTPKLQIVSKMNRAALETQPLLTANPQAALPLLAMIGQAQLSIEDLLGRVSRQFIEQMLLMAAESVAGAKPPGRHAGDVRWHGRQSGTVNLGASKLSAISAKRRSSARRAMRGSSRSAAGRQR